MKSEHEIAVRCFGGWSSPVVERWSAPTVLDKYLDNKANGYHGQIETLEVRLRALSDIVAKTLTKEQLLSLIDDLPYGYEVVDEQD